MILRKSHIASCLVFFLFAHVLSFFEPNTNTDAYIFDQLAHGAILRNVEGDFFSRFFLVLMFFVSLFLMTCQRFSFLFKDSVFRMLSILVVIIVLSSLWSPDPSVSFVRGAKQVLLILMLSFLSTYLTVDKFFDFMRFFGLVTLFVSFISVFFDFSWSYLGFKSIYGHKNTAGVVYAVFFILFSILFFTGEKYYNALIAVLFFLFLVLTKSKTSLFLSFVFSFGAFLIFRGGSYKGYLYAFVFPFVLFFLLIIFNLGFASENDVSFTGRVQIWDFVISEIGGLNFFGNGFGAFWNMGDSGLNYQFGGFYYEFIRNINQSHNSFLDVYIDLGYLGLFLVLVYVSYVLYFLGKIKEKISSSSFLLSVSLVSFFVIHSLMESTILRGENFLWFIFVFLSLLISKGNRDVRSANS